LSRVLTETVIGNTVLHKFDPRVKIFLLLVVSLLVIILNQPKALLLLLVLTLLGYPLAGIPKEKVKLLFLFLILGMWGTMFSQALFYSQEPRHILLVLIHPQTPILGPLTGGLFVYKEGFLYGAVQALRFSTMLSLGLLLCWTTEPRDFLVGFLKWKIPYEIAFMTITALRFLPLVTSETQTVLTAQKLRGFKAVKGGGIRQAIKVAFHVLLPILANCVRRAGNLAVSAESRAFRSENERTFWREISFQWWDKVVLLVVGLTMLLLCFIKIIYWLYYNGFCYFPYLRVLYDFAENWL